MKVIEFLKMSKVERAQIVSDKGIFIDGYTDKGEGIEVYYYDGFFVEITFTVNGQIIEVLPFVNGYKKGKYPFLGIQN